jgi:hypothetical protein
VRILVHGLALCVATLCVLALYAVAVTRGAKVSATTYVQTASLPVHRAASSQTHALASQDIRDKRRLARLRKRLRFFESAPVPFAVTEEDARKQIIRKLQAQEPTTEQWTNTNIESLCSELMSDPEKESYKQIILNHTSKAATLCLSSSTETLVGRSRYLEIVESCSADSALRYSQQKEHENKRWIGMLGLTSEQVARVQELESEYSDVFDLLEPREREPSRLDATGHFPTPQQEVSMESPQEEAVSEAQDEGENPRLKEFLVKFEGVLTPQQRDFMKKDYDNPAIFSTPWSMYLLYLYETSEEGQE